jgi:hypothetical protein
MIPTETTKRMKKFGEKFNRLTARHVVLLMLALTLCLEQSLASSHSSTNQPRDYLYWEEEVPETVTHQHSNTNEKQGEKRQLVWHGRMNDKHLTASEDASKLQSEPHSMRTNEWKLELNMSRKEQSRLGIHNKTLLLDFSETGHVRVMNSNNSTLAIGTWKLQPSGILWQFPIQQEYSLQCHADLILNPFGSRPRMVRGTIVKNCRKWFRPVVATFSAEGIGQDTIDVSYRERTFGLK